MVPFAYADHREASVLNWDSFITSWKLLVVKWDFKCRTFTTVYFFQCGIGTFTEGKELNSSSNTGWIYKCLCCPENKAASVLKSLSVASAGQKKLPAGKKGVRRSVCKQLKANRGGPLKPEQSESRWDADWQSKHQLIVQNCLFRKRLSRLGSQLSPCSLFCDLLCVAQSQQLSVYKHLEPLLGH